MFRYKKNIENNGDDGFNIKDILKPIFKQTIKIIHNVRYNIRNKLSYLFKQLVFNNPLILTSAFVIQTINAKLNFFTDNYNLMNFIFGLAIVTLFPSLYLSFKIRGNFINKICAIGNIILCSTNYLFVLNSKLYNKSLCMDTLINYLLYIEIIMIFLISIYITTKQFKEDDNNDRAI